MLFCMNTVLRLSRSRPQRPAALPRSAGGPEQAVRSDGSSILCGKHILIVEDNELNAEILSALLEREGASFDICENGKTALDTFVHAAPGTYNLILMDVQMPVMNGHEATSAIRDSIHPQRGPFRSSP